MSVHLLSTILMFPECSHVDIVICWCNDSSTDVTVRMTTVLPIHHVMYHVISSLHVIQLFTQEHKVALVNCFTQYFRFRTCFNHDVYLHISTTCAISFLFNIADLLTLIHFQRNQVYHQLNWLISFEISIIAQLKFNVTSTGCNIAELTILEVIVCKIRVKYCVSIILKFTFNYVL